MKGHMKQFYGFRSYLKELDDGHVQTLLNSLRRSFLCKEMGKIGNNNSRQQQAIADGTQQAKIKLPEIVCVQVSEDHWRMKKKLMLQKEVFFKFMEFIVVVMKKSVKIYI